MIRFVKIGNQVNEGANQFALFNTITDRFIDDDFGSVIWDSKEDFISGFENSQHTKLFKRYLALIPDNY